MGDYREDLDARYTNHLDIGQNAFEFLLDFGQFRNGEEKEPRIQVRLVTSPFYAKLFSNLLQESIRRYEQENGAIPGEEP